MKAQDVLSDNQNQVERNGVVIRKGSVGAFLANARIWCDPAVDASLRATAEADIVEGLPVLRELDLFDVFEVRNDALRALIEAN